MAPSTRHGTRHPAPGSFRVSAAVTVLVASLAIAATCAPALHGRQRPHFRSAPSDLVVLSAAVLDKDGGFLEGLDRERFAIYDEGKRQPIETFSNEDTPVSVGVLIDDSASMGPKIGEAVAATIAFAKSSHPEDELFTLSFNDRVHETLTGRAFLLGRRIDVADAGPTADGDVADRAADCDERLRSRRRAVRDDDVHAGQLKSGCADAVPVARGGPVDGCARARPLARSDESATGPEAEQRLAALGYREAVAVGSAQAAALFPGISRSGVTMGGSLFVGLTHEDAARYAFLLATPIIAAAALLKLPDLFGPDGNGVRGPALAGALCAGLAAWASVKFLMRYFETNRLTPFAWYCLLAGFGALLVFVL